MIYEGKAGIQGNIPKKITSKTAVFYNPIMSHNRDISVAVVNNMSKPRIADPLAATGIRAIRFLKECNIKHIDINDASKQAVTAIKKNLTLNKIPTKKYTIHNNEASKFLLNSEGFDYIDIDPYGSPNPFLDAAVRRLSRNGILALTATDTAALAGTSPKACQRKYWATPLRTSIMHEIGLRILIRKTQLIAAQYDKALTPILSYAAHHYYRVYLRNTKGKQAVANIQRQHSTYSENNHTAGPLWIGKLGKPEFIANLKTTCKECTHLLNTLAKETTINTIGFYNVSELASTTKTTAQKPDILIAAIQKQGYQATRTHFNGSAVRTNAPREEIKKILRQQNKKQPIIPSSPDQEP